MLVNALIHSREMKGPNWDAETNPNDTIKGAGDDLLRPLYEGNPTNTWDLFRDVYVKIYIYSSEKTYAADSGTGVSLKNNLKETRVEYFEGYKELEANFLED